MARRCTAIALLAAIAMSGCTGADAGADDQSEANSALANFSCPTVALPELPLREVGRPQPLQVVTTVAPITSIVASVAGDFADVRGVVPEGQNSHTYEPKPSVAKLFATADLAFVNGLKLELPTTEIAQQNMPDATGLIELGSLTIGPEQYLYDRSFPRDGGKPNPHLWTNPPMARCYANIAAGAMATADPEHAAQYRDNARALGQHIDELDTLMVAATATIPEAQRALLTYHDAYAYFAVRYDWRIIGAIQVSSFEEPTPKDVARLITQVRESKVPAIFGSEVFPSAVLEQIGNETGVNYVDALRDDDLPGEPGEANHSYLGLMQFDFVTMVSSLGGDATALSAFDPVSSSDDAAEYPQ